MKIGRQAWLVVLTVVLLVLAGVGAGLSGWAYQEAEQSRLVADRAAEAAEAAAAAARASATQAEQALGLAAQAQGAATSAEGVATVTQAAAAEIDEQIASLSETLSNLRNQAEELTAVVEGLEGTRPLMLSARQDIGALTDEQKIAYERSTATAEVTPEIWDGQRFSAPATGFYLVNLNYWTEEPAGSAARDMQIRLLRDGQVVGYAARGDGNPRAYAGYAEILKLEAGQSLETMAWLPDGGEVWVGMLILNIAKLSNEGQ